MSLIESKPGILFDRIRWEEKELSRQMELRGKAPLMIDAKALVLPLDAGPVEELPQLLLERCVSYYRGVNATAVLETHHAMVINSSHILKLCGNKIDTNLILAKSGVPTPQTAVAFSVESAMQAVEKIGLPCVMKPIVGSWGRQVVPVRSKETAEIVIEMREQTTDSMQSIFYVQEMIPRPPRDIRCIAVGEEIVACVYRYSPSDTWKTNVALGGRTEPCKVTAELEEILQKTIKAVGEGVLGIDVMERVPDAEYVVHEVNGTVEFKGAQQATPQSIAGRISDYVLAKLRR